MWEMGERIRHIPHARGRRDLPAPLPVKARAEGAVRRSVMPALCEEERRRWSPARHHRPGGHVIYAERAKRGPGLVDSLGGVVAPVRGRLPSRGSSTPPGGAVPSSAPYRNADRGRRLPRSPGRCWPPVGGVVPGRRKNRCASGPRGSATRRARGNSGAGLPGRRTRRHRTPSRHRRRYGTTRAQSAHRR